MARRLIGIVILLSSRALRADELLYSFEGDRLPYDEVEGWLVFSACEGPCAESIANGAFTLQWDKGGDFANYSKIIANAPDPPPANLWVEWRFASNQPLGANPLCDGGLLVDYKTIVTDTYLFGDAVASNDWGSVLSGYPLGKFRIHRFESTDGAEFRVFVEGELLTSVVEDVGGNDLHTLRMHGHGGCSLELQPTINRWDYVRYGTISYGEQMIASNPPGGFVDARVRALLDRFTVTYDQPNYVRVDETTVNVEGIERSRDQLLASRGTDTTVAPDLPHVTATRRRDNGPPHEVEIVLDKPIPFNATTRLILNDGVAVNVVEFTFAPGDTDGDGDADLADFSYLATCFGPTSPCPLLGKEGARCGPCLVLDMNSSGEVDAADYAVFFDLLVAP